ncbi:MAG: hypothetical protein LUD72_01085 [Bacteroidales bacterium]|nr:hypothetical protein [Bacteroidales bacterium]
MTGAKIYLEQRRRVGDGTWHRVGFFHGGDLAVEDVERRQGKSPDWEYRLVEFAETGGVFRDGRWERTENGRQ